MATLAEKRSYRGSCGLSGSEQQRAVFDFRRLKSLLPRAYEDVLILGASNCIGPKSFVAKLAKYQRVKIRNLSVGASSSAVGLYMLDRAKVSRRGLALIDYAINDTDAAYNLWREDRAPLFVGRHLRAISSRLRSLGYLPVLLFLPAELAGERPLLGELLHQRVCAEEGLNYLNVRSMFLQAARSGGDEAALMRDKWHMSGAAAELLALFVSEVSHRLSVSRRIRVKRQAPALARRVVLAETLFPQGMLVKRSSTLRSGSCGRLRKGDVIRVPVAANERLAGIMVNVGAAGGKISFRGEEGEATKLVTFAWSTVQPAVYFSILIDIAEPVVGGANGVVMQIAPDDAAVTEPTIHSRVSTADVAAEVEIEGALLTGIAEKVTTTSGYAYPSLPLDLGELPEAKRLLGGLIGLRATT